MMIRKDLPGLLNRLNETKTMSAKECADAYCVSISTYKNGLPDLNSSLKRHGIQIVSRSGRGMNIQGHSFFLNVCFKAEVSHTLRKSKSTVCSFERSNTLPDEAVNVQKA